jgi:hypothetical protein
MIVITADCFASALRAASGYTPDPMSRKNAGLVLAGLTILVIAISWFLPAIPQPLSYHNFADQRAWIGIANFGDVVSNVTFAIFGVWGMWFLLALAPDESREKFIDPRERWIYFVAFFGMLLTAFGSGYYHLAPDNHRLVWDRLPMTIVFMSLVTAMITERISVSLGFWLWAPLLVIGIASVMQWHLSETRGAGDLRFYGAVQAYAVLVFLVILFFPTNYTDGRYLAGVVGFYVLAKILETFDRQVFALGHIVSGHTLKHIAAAFGGYCILRMLQVRRVEPTAVRERLAA